MQEAVLEEFELVAKWPHAGEEEGGRRKRDVVRGDLKSATLHLATVCAVPTIPTLERRPLE